MKINAAVILAHFALEGIHKAIATDQNVFFHFKILSLQVLSEVSQVSLVGGMNELGYVRVIVK